MFKFHSFVQVPSMHVFCVFVHIGAETGNGHCIFLNCFQPHFIRQNISLKLELINLPGLFIQWSHWCLHWGYTHTHTHTHSLSLYHTHTQFLHRCWGFEHSRHSTNWAISPGPHSIHSTIWILLIGFRVINKYTTGLNYI